jgi:hypothetical protein
LRWWRSCGPPLIRVAVLSGCRPCTSLSPIHHRHLGGGFRIEFKPGPHCCMPRRSPSAQSAPTHPHRGSSVLSTPPPPPAILNLPGGPGPAARLSRHPPPPLGLNHPSPQLQRAGQLLAAATALAARLDNVPGDAVHVSAGWAGGGAAERKDAVQCRTETGGWKEGVAFGSSRKRASARAGRGRAHPGDVRTALGGRQRKRTFAAVPRGRMDAACRDP